MSIRQGNNIIAGRIESAGGLEICDIGMSLYVDESKGLRRRLNGSILAINKNTQAFYERLKEIATLYPQILTDEDGWQSTVLLSQYKQCGRFVINEDEQTIRLPKVVNVKGLQDLGMIGSYVTQTTDVTASGSTGEAGISGTTGGTGTSGTVSTCGDMGGWTSGVGNHNHAYAFGSLVAWNATTDAGAHSHSIGTNNHNHTFSTSAHTHTFNAGNHSHTMSANVQLSDDEAILYPYFIQIATGQETVVDIVNEIELNNPYSLFDCKFADHLLNNASWLRADTFDWYSGDVYVDAYNLLVEEYNASTDSISSFDGMIYRRTPNQYRIVPASEEQKVLDRYNSDNIHHWLYILDTENKRFKLPRTKWGFKGLRDSVGNGISESLPNITGTFGLVGISSSRGWNRNTTGAFSKSEVTSTSALGSATVGSQSMVDYFILNASRSSSTYQDGAPVQERATQMYLYFYVGEAVQNANLIDIGRITENYATRDFAQSASFPSNRFIDLTLGASGSTYTAPANGWFSVGGNDLETGNDFKYVMRIESTRFGVSSTNPSGTTGWLAGVLPVKKGDTVNIYYSGLTSTGVFFKFVYAEGSN